MSGVGTQFQVVFKRRWYNFIRSPGLFIFMAATSFIFTILTGVISIMIFRSFNETSSHTFDLKSANYDGKYIAVYYDPGVVNSAVITNDIQTKSGLLVKTFPSIADMESTLHDTDEIFSYALHIEQFDQNNLKATVYYNKTISSSEVYFSDISVGLSNILYKKLTTGDVKIKYEPLNAGFSSARLWCFFGPLLMSFAITNLAPQYSVLLVEDRETYRLYALQANGLSTWVYWVANFIFDYSTFVIQAIINWIILYLFDTAAITVNNWSTTFVLFVLSPLQTLPLVYFISLFFNTHNEAASMVLYLIMIIILIPYFIVTLVFENDIADSVSLGLSIVPSFAFQRGLSIAAERSVGLPLSAHETWTGHYLATYGIQIAGAVLYSVCAIITNYIKSIVPGKKAPNIVKDKDNVDEDVLNMEKDVDSTEHDSDALCVKHVDKVYADSNGNVFKAVNDVSLYVKQGEIFGVLGANGAGKSTLMSVITGRTPSSAGEIFMFGNQISSTLAAQKYVSVCPQFDTHLFPDMTPIQHFEMYGALKGYSKEKLADEISEYEQLMDLGKHRDKLVRELSGGNARKLAVALAFLGDAPIVFLDEPTASLDPVARLQAQELIEAKTKGRTILLCTHLLSEAERLCHRLCIMLTGQLHAVGTHQHLTEKFGTKWKIELGLVNDGKECRRKVEELIMGKFPGAELAGTRFSSATYNIPSGSIQLPQVFLILSENKGDDTGYTYFTCSMSTLERVFIDLVMATEV